MPKNPPKLLIDLSHIPEAQRDIVGEALSRQAVNILGRKGLLGGRFITGKLRPEIYGIIAPELLEGLDSNVIKGLDAALNKVR